MKKTIVDKNLQNLGVTSSSQYQIQETFRTLLLQKKVKQKDLGRYLGLAKASISRFCNGKQIPELRIRLKIAEFFGVDTSLIWRVPIIVPANTLDIKEVISHESSIDDNAVVGERSNNEVIAFQTKRPGNSSLSLCKETKDNEAVSTSTEGELNTDDKKSVDASHSEDNEEVRDEKA